MIVEEEDYLAHYGILRKSGRYPWGSGDDPKSFLDHIAKLREEGLSDLEIARGLDITTTDLRNARSVARNRKKAADISQAQRLKDKGYSNVAIGKKMEINESSVRSLLADGARDRVDIMEATANMLKDQVAEKGYIDVGSGVEQHLGISQTRLNTALSILKNEGYEVIPIQIDQLGTGAGKKTLIKTLAPPGTQYKDIVKDPSQIKTITEMTDDGGRSWYGLQPPLSISSKRVGINYAEDGGSDADGVIYVRPGKDDISLGGTNYAQVRIMVDGTHYLKGMAMYKDDLPKGVDLLFNTNKAKADIGTNKLDAMKAIKDDPDNPFGASIRKQLMKDNPDGTKTVTSSMNIINEEGNWDQWSRKLSSQTLSKQSPKLAQQQLNMAYEKKRQDLDEILSLTNPTVRKKLLDAYSEGADSSAIHLHAAALRRSSWHVLLPFNSVKETEIYAPNFRDGERVALIRYPHGGTFEIPELTVNNRNPAAIKAIGRAKDAVGINAEVAKRLSGADFDGDAVIVIPNRGKQIKTSPALEGLKDFDPQREYPGYDGMKTIDGGTYNAKTRKVEFKEGQRPSSRGKGMQMGLVSNLITDMTLQGASRSELAAAVRHSMVVIDAEKHGLNWKQSSINNGIPNLMKKYQGRSQGGASTLISRATSPVKVNARRPRPASKGGPVDKATGQKKWEETGEHWIDAKGNKVFKKQDSVKLAETEDAHTLVSKDGGTQIEKIYADHSNRMKGLANEARKASVNTTTIPYSPSARKAYAPEVSSLNAKIQLAYRNRPLERQAQVLANTIVKMKRDANPTMDAADLKKIRAQSLEEARRRTGAKKAQIEITDNEWKAIQEGAISNSRLKDILDNANLDRVKELATPRTSVLMSATKLNRAASMLAAGYTQAEIADHLGVSLTTLKEGING